MKAKKKPIVLDVWQIDVEALRKYEAPNWVIHEWDNSMGNIKSYDDGLLILTLEGSMTAKIGDYIVKGTKGEIWPVRKDIFEETYDIVEE
ncbi:hypothetical protein G7084_01375 [Weissella coleopterorum]|uniref:Phage protein n=1 Tax=Weissella coleopterorum TaxID=2714949 RepID=A0A6G8AYE9_9LACO|nr:hypothetical protein [Weissella coleopterorum]QIL50088.1 hypothetical protein G7084_01375 [Weissella coleopterorum]